MTERLLQFIWQYQYYNANGLSSATGETIQVLFPGQFNTNQGPDFSNARIRIDDTVWIGTAELHLKTSDWNRHAHTDDKNYNNVILHVVWEDDAQVNTIPVLELGTRVSKLLLHRYQELMDSTSFIPCEAGISAIPSLIWENWKERLLAERLMRKALQVHELLQQNRCHWEETLWWLLAKNFGASVNADAFEAIARSIPVRVLSKNKHQVQQLEALLLGQAGLLDNAFTDHYAQLLKKEYKFLRYKYQLRRVHVPLHFLRMRPGNFPTIRLAQLAMLVHESTHLLDKLRETVTVTDARKLFTVTANDYWHYHYRLGEPSSFAKKTLGTSMVNSVIINTVVPILFAYGDYHHDQLYKDRSIEWLEQTAAESNNITRGFVKAGIENKTAFDSQALLELKTQYCDKRRCLDCTIGNSLLKMRKEQS